MKKGWWIFILIIFVILILGIFFYFYFKTSVKSMSPEMITKLKKQCDGEYTPCTEEWCIKTIMDPIKQERICFIPVTRKIILNKNDKAFPGFVFLIKNIENSTENFSYEINASDISCPDLMTLSDADKLIADKKSEENILISEGDWIDYPIMIPFNIPKSTPSCEIHYNLSVFYKETIAYTSPVLIDVKIN